MSKLIPCEDVDEAITGYLLNELPEAERDRVAGHLNACEDCRALSRDLELTLGLLGDALAVGADDAPRLDPVKKQALLQPTDDLPTPIVFPPWLRVAAMLAALGLVGLIAARFLQTSGTMDVAKTQEAVAPVVAPEPEPSRDGFENNMAEHDDTLEDSKGIPPPMKSLADRDRSDPMPETPMDPFSEGERKDGFSAPESQSFEGGLREIEAASKKRKAPMPTLAPAEPVPPPPSAVPLPVVSDKEKTLRKLQAADELKDLDSELESVAEVLKAEAVSEYGGVALTKKLPRAIDPRPFPMEESVEAEMPAPAPSGPDAPVGNSLAINQPLDVFPDEPTLAKQDVVPERRQSRAKAAAPEITTYDYGDGDLDALHRQPMRNTKSEMRARRSTEGPSPAPKPRVAVKSAPRPKPSASALAPRKENEESEVVAPVGGLAGKGRGFKGAEIMDIAKVDEPARFNYTREEKNVSLSVDFVEPSTGTNRLVDVGVKARELGEEARPPLALTCLLDNSEGMKDRLPLLKASLTSLAESLQEQDTLTVVRTGEPVGMVMDRVEAKNLAFIRKAIDRVDVAGERDWEASVSAGRIIDQKSKKAVHEDAVHAMLVFSDQLPGAKELGRQRAANSLSLVRLGDAPVVGEDAKIDTRALRLRTEKAAAETLDSAFLNQLVAVARQVQVRVEWDKNRVGGARRFGLEGTSNLFYDVWGTQVLHAGEEVVNRYSVLTDAASSGTVGSVTLYYRNALNGQTPTLSVPIVLEKPAPASAPSKPE